MLADDIRPGRVDLPVMTVAHHAVVLTTKGKSYHMRKRRTREDFS